MIKPAWGKLVQGVTTGSADLAPCAISQVSPANDYEP